MTSSTAESVPCSASFNRSAATNRGSAESSAMHHALGRPEDHHRRHPVALHLDLGAGDGRTTRADDLANLRDRLRTETEGGDTRRPVDAEHVVDAELAAHHQYRRVDAATAVGHRRHDQRDQWHAGDHRRHAELVGDARVAGLAAGHEQTGRTDRRDLLADVQTGLALEAPVGGTADQLLVERPQVGDGVVDRLVDVVGDLGAGRARRASPAADRARATTWSKSCRARHTASSPLARTSSMIRPIAAFRSRSKMASRPRSHSVGRASSSIADQVIVRITDMSDEGIGLPIG